MELNSMTAMTLYLVDARMLEARQNLVSSSGSSMRVLLAETIRVLIGGITPVHGTRAVLGDTISRDLGLRERNTID